MQESSLLREEIGFKRAEQEGEGISQKRNIENDFQRQSESVATLHSALQGLESLGQEMTWRLHE